MAWLQARPKPKRPAPTGGVAGREPVGDAPPVPRRIDAMKAEGIEPPIPPNPASYITDWLFEIGPMAVGGMGPAPIGWGDIETWARLTGVAPLPFEARLLRRLSGEFISELSRAEDPAAPPPWMSAEATVRNRAAVSRTIGNAFKAMALAQKGKG